MVTRREVVAGGAAVAAVGLTGAAAAKPVADLLGQHDALGLAQLVAKRTD